MQCLQFVKRFHTGSNQSDKLLWYQGARRILINGMFIANQLSVTTCRNGSRAKNKKNSSQGIREFGHVGGIAKVTG